MHDATPATATFLFTDIEGSTDLLRSHREAYASILADHHRLLREAFAAHGGREVDNQGDAFFVAFTRARSAALAAAAAQRALAGHDWPGGAVVRVRMGIHSERLTSPPSATSACRFIEPRGSARSGTEARSSSRRLRPGSSTTR